MESEISRCEELLTSQFGTRPVGFRAPGYGFSRQLIDILAKRGYRYDSSLMAGPYGPVFRWMDRRLQKRAGGKAIAKTQYARLSDAREPLSPRRIAGELIEFPAATSPLLRLPFQAGVCMRLGRKYFDAQLAAFAKRPNLPLLFLMHAADIADFGGVDIPFFRQVPYFATPAAEKHAALSYFLSRITKTRQVRTTEDWLASGDANDFIRAS
jgi:hypothetical protein